MERQDQYHHTELQLIPTHLAHNNPSPTYLSSWSTGCSSKASEAFDAPSLDLQLSISLQPLGDKKMDMSCIEAVKWQAKEQFRLASLEKAYAERVREMTRREMELAHSEFARARLLWERAQDEVEKAERLKARAAGSQTDSACMEITCQACRRRFRP